MSKLSNKNDKDKPDNKKELGKMPLNALAKGLKGGLLAAVHDSLESLRFHGFKLEK